jgi:hypothetical protein
MRSGGGGGEQCGGECGHEPGTSLRQSMPCPRLRIRSQQGMAKDFCGVHRKCYVHDHVNMGSSLNIERTLVDALCERLAETEWLETEVSFHQSRASAEQGDAVVQLRAAGRCRGRLYVHAKSEVRPGSFPAWALQRMPPKSKEPAVAVLAAPVVSSRLADLCHEAGWGWIDLAGNCRIDVPGLLRLEHSGSSPVHKQPVRGARLGTAAVGRVIRVLLSPGNAGRRWKQRDLQGGTCSRMPGDQPVSLGLVNKVVRHLLDEGFAEELEKEPGVRVRDPQGLLKAWNAAYRFDRHEQRTYFTLLKGKALEEALHQLSLEAGFGVAYAVFSAAERQAPSVRQPKTWVYVHLRLLDAFVKRVQAKEVESGENVVVLIPEDAGVFLSLHESDAHMGDQILDCTDPVQTYVDLMHAGGRGEEAAVALATQKILPAWKAVGSS